MAVGGVVDAVAHAYGRYNIRCLMSRQMDVYEIMALDGWVGQAARLIFDGI